jgi:hypothetical protein
VCSQLRRHKALLSNEARNAVPPKRPSHDGIIAIGGTEGHQFKRLGVLARVPVLAGVEVRALQEESELAPVYNGITPNPSVLLFQGFWRFRYKFVTFLENQSRVR